MTSDRRRIHRAVNEGADTSRFSPGWFFVAATGVVTAWILFQVGWLTGQVFDATRFILGDQGSYLYAVGRWQAGEMLYRDFAWQYGPLALGWYRAFAAVGGNTPLTLVVASSFAFAIAWVLVARLVSRVAGWGWGGGFAVLVLLPVMSASGPMTLNGPHGAIEMLLLAGCAWTLAQEGGRAWRPWQLGLMAGLLQWVRFGPHVVALAVILMVTARQEWSRPEGAGTFARRMGIFAGRLLGGYGLAAVPLAGWYLHALPLAAAREQFWPAYMVSHYAGSYSHRWPQVASLQEFGLRWLPAILGVALALIRLAPGVARDRMRETSGQSSAEAGLWFFPLQYLLGCAVLFRNDYAITGYLWLAWPGLALAARVGRRGWRAAVIGVAMPGAVATIAAVWEQQRDERALQARPFPLPNGQVLWFHGREAGRFGQLREALDAAPGSRRVALFYMGGGIHHFFATQRVGRHWWFLPEFVRPREEAVALRALLQHDLIIVANRAAAAELVAVTLPLSRAMGDELRPYLENPRHVEGVGVLLQIRHGTGEGQPLKPR